MLNNDFIQTLSARAAELFPAAQAARKDIEENMYALLQSSLGKLNLVTREEFDVQLKVLERAQQQIADLEQKIADLALAAEQNQNPDAAINTKPQNQNADN